MSTVKFGKCFAELMIPIALLKVFGSYIFVTPMGAYTSFYPLVLGKKVNKGG